MLVRDVGLDCLGLIALGGQLLSQRSDAVATPRAEDDGRAALRKVTRGGFAKPAACPGDDDHFVFNSLGHDDLLFGF
jgi:hypothetical protein